MYRARKSKWRDVVVKASQGPSHCVACEGQGKEETEEHFLATADSQGVGDAMQRAEGKEHEAVLSQEHDPLVSQEGGSKDTEEEELKEEDGRSSQGAEAAELLSRAAEQDKTGAVEQDASVLLTRGVARVEAEASGGGGASEVNGGASKPAGAGARASKAKQSKSSALFGDDDEEEDALVFECVRACVRESASEEWLWL